MALRPIDPAVIGLVPAAGHARRIAPLPCSKELLPLWRASDDDRPRAVCEHALARMREGGIGRACVIIREGKWDIPAHLGSGPKDGPSLAYLLAPLPYGVPFTLDAAHAFVQAQRVALAFPDILFEAEDAFARLLDRQSRDGADVVLGLFPADRPRTMDVLELDGTAIRRILVKPNETTLRLTWGIAVWTRAFTHFMHEHLARLVRGARIGGELHLGEVLQAGIDAGLRVEGLAVSDAPYLDIGTPEGLRRARERLAER